MADKERGSRTGKQSGRMEDRPRQRDIQAEITDIYTKISTLDPHPPPRRSVYIQTERDSDRQTSRLRHYTYIQINTQTGRGKETDRETV